MHTCLHMHIAAAALCAAAFVPDGHMEYTKLYLYSVVFHTIKGDATSVAISPKPRVLNFFENHHPPHFAFVHASASWSTSSCR